MNYDKNVAGLYTAKKTYLHPADKRDAVYAGYRRVEIPLSRWVECHRRGLLSIPGDMVSYRDDFGQQAYSHAEALWHGTEWVVADLDSDDIDTHDITCLPQLCPGAEELLFAACESLSANVDGRYARWHGFFLLERPITRREEYHALLLGLRERIWVLEGVGRNPAQPVFGNGRPDAYYELFENVLSVSVMKTLVEVGYSLNPSLREARVQARDTVQGGYVGSRSITRELLTDYSRIEPPKLREFLSDFQVPVYAGKKTQGSRTLYYLPCPFSAEHTVDVAPTDAFLTVEDDGRWGFGCFHNHCQKRLETAKRLDETASGWKLFADAVRCPVRMGLKQVGLKVSCVLHEKEARVYEGVPCPRHAGHRGIAVFRHEDKGRIFLCDEAACEPLGWQEFRQMHRAQEVAA